MTSEERAERLYFAGFSMGQEMIISQEIQDAVRAAYEDAAKIAESVVITDCGSRGDVVAARKSGAERAKVVIAAAIRERIQKGP